MLAAPFARRPFALQRLRWPNPLRAPYTQSEINLYRPGELGDVVMCLAVVRAIRKKNPRAKITFITNYHALHAGHPLLDRVMSLEDAQREGVKNIISLRYEVFIPLRLHLIDYLAGCVGLKNISHEIPLPDFTSELGELARAIPPTRPRVMICRSSGPFTPNKDWPTERWDELIERLATHATVVELGTAAPVNSPAARHVDLRGRTTLRQFCALLAQADLVITPVTSAVHIAAAYSVPTLAIVSGYESPECSAYPRRTALYHTVPCSGCWLREPCPHDLKCLRAISVEEVFATAQRLLGESNRLRAGQPGAGETP